MPITKTKKTASERVAAILGLPSTEVAVLDDGDTITINRVRPAKGPDADHYKMGQKRPVKVPTQYMEAVEIQLTSEQETAILNALG